MGGVLQAKRADMSCLAHWQRCVIVLLCILCACSGQHIWDVSEGQHATEASPWDPNKTPQHPQEAISNRPKSLRQQKEAHDFQDAVAQAQIHRESPAPSRLRARETHRAASSPHKQYHGPSVNTLEAAGRVAGGEAAGGQVPLWLLKMRMEGSKPAVPKARKAKIEKEVNPWDDAQSIDDKYEQTQTHFLDAVAPVNNDNQT